MILITRFLSAVMQFPYYRVLRNLDPRSKIAGGLWREVLDPATPPLSTVMQFPQYRVLRNLDPRSKILERSLGSSNVPP